MGRKSAKFLSGKTERPVTEQREGGNQVEKKEKKRDGKQEIYPLL
jgi:hypothetical protein